MAEVILCTDQTDSSAVIKGMEMDAFDYILKTITPEELLYKMSDAHQKRFLHEEKTKNFKHTFTDTVKK